MSDIANIKVEPCSVEWDGADLGFTDGDIEITTEETGAEITAHQEGTNVLDMIRTGKKVELSVTLKETSAAQVQAMLSAGGGVSGGVAKIETIVCVADSSGSLNNTVFFIQGKNPTTKAVTDYAVYLNVNSAGVDPSIPGKTSVEVAVATNDASTAVADAVAAALDALADFAAPNPGASTVTVTHSEVGARDASDAGNTGFTMAVSTAGVNALTGWGKSKDFTGMLSDSAKLVLHPVVNDVADLDGDLAFWKAYPMVGSIVQSGENPKTVSITFKIFPDSSKPDETRLFAFGDHA